MVGEANNGREALERIDPAQVDITLLDLVMLEMDGTEVIQQLRQHQVKVNILVLTSFATDDKVFPAIKAGAVGYLIKDTAPEELVHAIYQIAQGKPSLHPLIAQKLLQEISSEKERSEESQALTEREVEVIKLLAHGLNNQEIAERLFISLATVYMHVSNILSELHLASRTQAALYALREGLATLEDVNRDNNCLKLRNSWYNHDNSHITGAREFMSEKKRNLPKWALRLAEAQDWQQARALQEKNQLLTNWESLDSMKTWAKEMGWPTSWLFSQESFLKKMCESKENFALVLSGSDLEVYLPKTEYTFSAQELLELDDAYDKGEWRWLVEALREIRRAVEAGVIAEVAGVKLTDFNSFYTWAHGRYHALEDDVNTGWIGDDSRHRF